MTTGDRVHLRERHPDDDGLVIMPGSRGMVVGTKGHDEAVVSWDPPASSYATVPIRLLEVVNVRPRQG